MEGSKKVSRCEALINIKDYVSKELFKLLSAQVQLRSLSKKKEVVRGDNVVCCEPLLSRAKGLQGPVS